MSSNWSNLCILSHVLNILGPFNCANQVCQAWNKCKKIYHYVYVKNEIEFQKILDNLCVDRILSLDLDFELGMSLRVHMIVHEEIDKCYVVMAQLKKFVSLKRLGCGNWFNYDDKFMDIISELKKLEEFEDLDIIWDKSLTSEGMKKFKNLRKLELWECFTDNIDEGFENGWGYRMNELSLMYLRRISRRCVEVICGLNTVHTLAVINCGITDEFVIMLSEMQSLVNLDISYNCFTDFGLKHLIDKKKNILESLNIGYNDFITSESLIFLRNLTKLTKLDLSNMTNMSNDIIINICNINLNKLRVLYVSNTISITDEAFKSIHHLTNLEELIICGCTKITDISIQYINKSTSINNLNINGCRNITDEGLDDLRGNHYLRKLHVEYWPEKGKLTRNCIHRFKDEMIKKYGDLFLFYVYDITI